MREGRARPGGRSGTELGLVLAGLVLLHGIAGIISLFGAEAGADIILQMFGLAAVRSTIAADAESASDTAADIALTEGAPGVSGGSGHAAAEGGGLAADGTPLAGNRPAPAGSTATEQPPESIVQPPGPSESESASQRREAPVPAKRAALTFDDGPDRKYTPMVLDILSQYGVTATFFVVGTQAERYPEVLARIRDEGHEIGSHGYAHADMGKMTAADIAEDLRLADEALREAAGIVPALFRPPYGSVSDELKGAVGFGQEARPLECRSPRLGRHTGRRNRIPCAGTRERRRDHSAAQFRRQERRSQRNDRGAAGDHRRAAGTGV